MYRNKSFLGCSAVFNNMKCFKDQKAREKFISVMPWEPAPRGSGSCNDQCQWTAVPASWVFKGFWHRRTEVFAWLCLFSPLLFCHFIFPSSLKYLEWSCFPEKSWMELTFKTGYYILFTIKIITCGKHPPNFYYQLEKNLPISTGFIWCPTIFFFFTFYKGYSIYNMLYVFRESSKLQKLSMNSSIVLIDICTVTYFVLPWLFVFQETLSY